MEKESYYSHKVTKCVTSVTEMSHHSHSHMTDNMRTIGSEVHSYNSSCIYSIEN